MVEVIAIFGCFGLLLLLFFGWLSALPCFFTVMTVLGAVPLVSLCDYFHLRQESNLRAIRLKREPIPPERFNWIIQKARLKRTIFICSILTLASAGVAIAFPVSGHLDWYVLIAWASLLFCVAISSRLISAIILFFRASQWFDTMSPVIVGSIRKAMYQLSDNYEYLGHRPRDTEKENVY